MKNNTFLGVFYCFFCIEYKKNFLQYFVLMLLHCIIKEYSFTLKNTFLVITTYEDFVCNEHEPFNVI